MMKTMKGIAQHVSYHSHLEKGLIRFRIIITVLLGILSFVSQAQELARPHVWGIAKMTYYVSDFSVAKAYYGDFLGFEEAFRYPSEKGTILTLKVNDRQFLEFIEDENPKSKKFLASISFDCDELEEMEAYLRSKDIEILKPTGKDDAGNETLIVRSTEQYSIEFIRYGKDGLHLKSKGKYLGEHRISHRIHHSGLYVSDILKADELYRKVLGFEEFWSYKEPNSSFIKYVYLRIPDCVENIEYTLAGNGSHPCFLVNDMQVAIYNLKERKGDNELGRPVIGKGKRWLMNMYNSDGARVEFTEAYTVN